jgi:hypothetical protein
MDWRIVAISSEECESEALARATFSLMRSTIPEGSKAYLQKRQQAIGEEIPCGSWITVDRTE